MKNKQCRCGGKMRSGGAVCMKCGGQKMSFGGAIKKYRDGGPVTDPPKPDSPETNPKKKKTWAGYEYYNDAEGFPVVTISDKEVYGEEDKNNYDYLTDNIVIDKPKINSNLVKVPEIKMLEPDFDAPTTIKEAKTKTTEPIVEEVENKDDNVKSEKVKTLNYSLPNWGHAKFEQQKLNDLIRKDIAAGVTGLELLNEDDIIGPKTLAAMNAYQSKGMYERPEGFKDEWLQKYKEDYAKGIRLQVPGVNKPIENKVPKLPKKEAIDMPKDNVEPADIETKEEKSTIQSIYDYFRSGVKDKNITAIERGIKDFEKKNVKEKKKETPIKNIPVSESSTVFNTIDKFLPGVGTATEKVLGEASKYGKGLYDRYKSYRDEVSTVYYEQAQREYDKQQAEHLKTYRTKLNKGPSAFKGMNQNAANMMQTSKEHKEKQALDMYMKGSMDGEYPAKKESIYSMYDRINLSPMKESISKGFNKTVNTAKDVISYLDKEIKDYQYKEDKKYAEEFDKNYPAESKKAGMKTDIRKIQDKIKYLEKAQNFLIGSPNPSFKTGYIRNDGNDPQIYKFLDELELKVYNDPKYKGKSETYKGQVVRKLISDAIKELTDEEYKIKKQIGIPNIKWKKGVKLPPVNQW